MKRKTLTIIITIILALGILGILVSGACVYRLKFYCFNKQNVYAQKSIIRLFENIYHQKFYLISTEFETRENTTYESVYDKYTYIWTFEMQDDSGRQFTAYLWRNGSSKSRGSSIREEYEYMNVASDYGQILVEEFLKNDLNLYKYRQQKNNTLLDGKEYIFIYPEDNLSEIAEMLTKIYFAEKEISKYGCVRCAVINDKGQEIYTYTYLSIAKEVGESSEETVYNYIMQKLMNNLINNM